MEWNRITVSEIFGALTVCSEKGGSSRIDNRKSYGLSLCVDGQITYSQNGKEYPLHKGCAVLLPKGGTYVIRWDKSGSFPVINFDCSEPLCDTVTVIPIPNAEELLADYERIKRLLCFDGNRAQIFSIFYGMLHKLSSDGIPHELRGAMRLIRGDFCDGSLTNARLAYECNISEVYFRKLFTKHFGISPKQFIIDLRIQRAKQMLAEGERSVSVISEQCGFSSPYHFCRIFKQRVGTTPSEYRKANRTFQNL